jgi:plastocyanin
MIRSVNRKPAATVSRSAPLIAALATATVALAGCGMTHNTNTPVAPPPSAQPTLGVIPSVDPIPLDTPAPAANTADLTMVDQSFRPSTLYVTPGTVINLTNKMDFICGVTDDKHGLRSGDVGPGASVHFTAPDTPGTYNYSCIYLDPGQMKGKLVVTTDPNAAKQKDDADAAAKTASPTPTPNSTSTPNSFSNDSSTLESTPSSTPSAIHTHETTG